MNNGTRDIHMDVVTGIMILYMMLGHIGHPYLDFYKCLAPLHYALFFFMPRFFYKSGFYFKQKSFLEEIHNSAKRLLRPYFIFTLFGLFINWLILLHHGDINRYHYILTPVKEFVLAGETTGNQPLWFLFDLFLIRCLYNLVNSKMQKKCHSKSGMIIFMTVGILLFIIEYCKRYNNYTIDFVNHYVWTPVFRIVPGLLFFSFGYIMRSIKTRWSLSIGCLIVYFFITMLKPSFVGSIDDRLNENGSYLLFIINTFACLVLITYIFFIFSKYHYFPLLSTLGKYSMSLYVMHMPFIRLISEYTSFSNEMYGVAVCSIVIFILLPVIIYGMYKMKLEYLFGE